MNTAREKTKMVTCNFCRKNKDVEELEEEGYYYVCKECFKKMVITIEGLQVNKEYLY